MRYPMAKPWCAAGALGIALLIATLALPAVSYADPPKKIPDGMPLIVPAQSLRFMRQMNRATNFNVMRLSQVAIGNEGPVTQLALVDVEQRNRAFNRSGPVPLFVLARDLPLIRQLNQGANINTLAVFQTAIDNRGTIDQVALVNITQTNDSLNKISPLDTLLVVPRESLPAVQQLNAGTNFNLVRISQVAAGNVGPVSQTALVSVQQKNGIANAAQPFPLLVPAQAVPALIQLNVGVNINVVNIFQVAVGNTGQVTQVALVNVTQKNEELNVG